MILVDTSVWVDHLRHGDPALSARLQAAQVLGHPWVLGELLLGNLSAGSETHRLLGLLPQAVVARDDEVRRLVVAERLAAHGIGYVDAQLLTSVRLTPGAVLWTRDGRLKSAGARLGASLADE